MGLTKNCGWRYNTLRDAMKKAQQMNKERRGCYRVAQVSPKFDLLAFVIVQIFGYQSGGLVVDSARHDNGKPYWVAEEKIIYSVPMEELL
tara:strand:- start:714 stop:983 length:270 start_codon:yes stop_codon:yes gene_type:complete